MTNFEKDICTEAIEYVKDHLSITTEQAVALISKMKKEYKNAQSKK